MSTALFPAPETILLPLDGTCFGTWPQINVSVFMRASYLENPDYFRRNFARINHSAANFLAYVPHKSDERHANGTIDNKTSVGE